MRKESGFVPRPEAPETKETEEKCEHGNPKGSCEICNREKEEVSRVVGEGEEVVGEGERREEGEKKEDKEVRKQEKVEPEDLPRVDKKTGHYIDENGEAWSVQHDLAKEIGFSSGGLDSYVEDIASIQGRDRLGREATLYNERELKEKHGDALNLPRVDKKTGHYIDENGESWASQNFLARKFGLRGKKFSSYLEGITSIRGRGGAGKIGLLYNEKEFTEKRHDVLSLPRVDKKTGIYVDESGKKWATRSSIRRQLGLSERYTERIAKTADRIKGRGKGGGINFLYNLSQVAQAVQESGHLDQREGKREKEQKEETEKKLKQFGEEAAEGKTINAQEFRRLVGLFGGSNAVDVLYAYRPEFQGLPVEQVKSILADYLGDFLVEKGPFSPIVIKSGAKYLSNKNLREALFETIKDACLISYRKEKKKNPDRGDLAIIEDYLVDIEEQTHKLRNELLNGVTERILEYYGSLFEDFEKPPQIVDTLREGREFPDVNQLINMKETADKKKMLIADEMGLGKSASAILTKEYLGLKQALAIIPSNVIPTWEKYLSDDREQGGYFKKGQAPKVLAVRNLQSLQEADVAAYDYILVSQERLTSRYTKALEGLDNDMLIVDEVHRLKNLKRGKRAANIIKLAAKIEGPDKYLLPLSGTPVPNKIEDVAMILKLLYPEKFEEIENKKLIKDIIQGDIVNLRSLLVPRMQKKELTESIEMPNLEEQVIELNLSLQEQEVYEILMEEDELTAPQKMQILRQFLLNPEILDSTPDIQSSKIQAAREHLRQTLAAKDKVVMFVNGYIENVIRGELSIIDKLGLPPEVEVKVIEGEISKKRREAIQKELSDPGKKMLLIISGQTAGVGVDFSAGEEVVFYNEPWTRYDQKQQLGRVYREGLKKDLVSNTFVTKGTIEEGIHRYIGTKQQAIEKLLQGIPRTELENKLLEENEKQEEPNLEVNPELAEYYFSAWDRMMKIFGYVRELGEKDFRRFLSKFGREYADCYIDLGSRSYQANGVRVVGTMLDELRRKGRQKAEEIKVLDIASGPEMLRKHIADDYDKQVFSLDINKHHFAGKGEKRIVGSFLNLPIKENSFDYAALSFALHYTKFIPSRDEYERVAVLAEMNRILKEKGKAVINLVYSSDLKDEEKFRTAIEALGFKVVDKYSGEVSGGKHYHSRVITLEKQKDIGGDLPALIKDIGKENFDGLKFIKKVVRLKDTRKIIESFDVAGKALKTKFNKKDYDVLREEKKITNKGERLKKRHKGIKAIPREKVIENGFSRIFNGKRYVLFRKLEKGEGCVVVR